MAKALVFHYAPWSRLEAILNSGELRPSNAGAPSEKPLLWFSAHQYWEPTATKILVTPSGLRDMTFEEHRERFGCIRFGLEVGDPRLIAWKDACAVAGIGKLARRALEDAGRKRGGKPEHWYATAVAVALGDLRFEVLLDKWYDDADAAEMAGAWRRSRR